MSSELRDTPAVARASGTVTMTGRVRPVSELTKAIPSLERRATPEVMRIVIDDDVKIAMTKFDIAIAGVPHPLRVTTADAEARIREAANTAHDESLQADILQHAADEAATERDLEARIQASRAWPTTRDDTRELLLLRRFEGATLADVRRAYAAADDAGDPVGVRLVEEHLGAWHARLRLTPHTTDADEATRLLALVEARRTARQDPKATADLAALRESRAARHLFEHALAAARTGDLRVARPWR